MTAIKLKKLLIHRIEEIDDEAFLYAIKTILDSKTQLQVLNLNNEQRAEITESKKQIDEGHYVDQSEMDEEFKRWLKEK